MKQERVGQGPTMFLHSQNTRSTAPIIDRLVRIGVPLTLIAPSLLLTVTVQNVGRLRRNDLVYER